MFPMETEKLYYADPFLQDFTATVLSCEAGKGGYLVTLDRTAFYPEGGGQPADHGTMNGLAVTDVHEKKMCIRDRPLSGPAQPRGEEQHRPALQRGGRPAPGHDRPRLPGDHHLSLIHI